MTSLQEVAEAAYPKDAGTQRSFQSVQQRAFIAGAEWALEEAAQKAKSMSDNEPDGYYGQACFEVAAAIRSLSTTTTEEESND